MSTCHEKADSLTFRVGSQNSSATSTYIVMEETSELGALAAAIATSPETHVFGIGTSTVTLVRSDLSAKNVSFNVWEVDVSWSEQDSIRSEQRPEGQSIESMVRIAFDTTGQTQKITIGLSEVSRAELNSEYPAPDLGGAINWDGKTLQGVDKIIPSLKITATAPYPVPSVTTEFIANLSRHTGKTNEKDWHGFKAGELLYTGSTGAKEVPLLGGISRSKPVEISHAFEASQNQDSLTTGGITLSEGKKGWDYSWARFEDQDDENNVVFPKAVHLYVVKIYESVDFKELFGF